MNRTKQLKLLNDEIHRLFSEGVEEKTAFDQLQSDERFESVRRSSIQSLYKKLQKDADKVAIKEAKKKQLKEQKHLKQCRQKAKDLLLYDAIALNEYIHFGGFWKGRYLVSLKSYQSIRGIQTINVHDIYQGMSKEISFPVDFVSYNFNALNENFLLFCETGNEHCFAKLAQVDLVKGTLQIIQTFERAHPLFITDSTDSTKFLLNFHSDNHAEGIEICKLVNGRIEIEQEFEFGHWGSFYGVMNYFKDQLLAFQINDDMSESKILIQNLDEEKKSSTLLLKQLPSSIHFYNHILLCYHCCKWSSDYLFIGVEFRSTGEFGVAFTELRTCAWTALDFVINLSIERIFFVENRDLLISTGTHSIDGNRNITSEVSQIYKLPVRKPDSLRNKAWFKTVMLFKKRKVANPYVQARRCLPLNSDIRGYFNVEKDSDE